MNVYNIDEKKFTEEKPHVQLNESNEEPEFIMAKSNWTSQNQSPVLKPKLNSNTKGSINQNKNDTDKEAEFELKINCLKEQLDGSLVVDSFDKSNFSEFYMTESNIDSKVKYRKSGLFSIESSDIKPENLGVLDGNLKNEFGYFHLTPKDHQKSRGKKLADQNPNDNHCILKYLDDSLNIYTIQPTLDDNLRKQAPLNKENDSFDDMRSRTPPINPPPREPLYQDCYIPDYKRRKSNKFDKSPLITPPNFIFEMGSPLAKPLHRKRSSDSKQIPIKKNPKIISLNLSLLNSSNIFQSQVIKEVPENLEDQITTPRHRKFRPKIVSCCSLNSEDKFKPTFDGFEEFEFDSIENGSSKLYIEKREDDEPIYLCTLDDEFFNTDDMNSVDFNALVASRLGTPTLIASRLGTPRSLRMISKEEFQEDLNLNKKTYTSKFSSYFTPKNVAITALKASCFMVASGLFVLNAVTGIDVLPKDKKDDDISKSPEKD